MNQGRKDSSDQVGGDVSEGGIEGARVNAVGLLLPVVVVVVLVLTLQSSSYPIIRFPMTNYLFLILTFIPHDEGVPRRQALSRHR